VVAAPGGGWLVDLHLYGWYHAMTISVLLHPWLATDAEWPSTGSIGDMALGSQDKGPPFGCSAALAQGWSGLIVCMGVGVEENAAKQHVVV
jgi:hypothetical protein